MGSLAELGALRLLEFLVGLVDLLSVSSSTMVSISRRPGVGMEGQAKQAMEEWGKKRKEKQEERPAKPRSRQDLSGTVDDPSTSSVWDNRFALALEGCICSCSVRPDGRREHQSRGAKV
jgi:hypothetical protein